jgi:hypothetical protein
MEWVEVVTTFKTMAIIWETQENRWWWLAWRIVNCELMLRATATLRHWIFICHKIGSWQGEQCAKMANRRR